MNNALLRARSWHNLHRNYYWTVPSTDA